MTGQYTEKNSDCKTRNLLACLGRNWAYSEAMPDWRKLTITQRLIVLRKAYGLSQEAMADELGIDPEADTYGHAERTGNVAQIAPKIWTRFEGVDAGWLFQGLTGNMPAAAEKRLSEAYSALEASGLLSRAKRNNR